MYKKMVTSLVLLDHSKGFDSIDHERLLNKVSTLGASPSTVKVFRSYLSEYQNANRIPEYQYVRINSIHSDTLPITHVVPQGATLSPVLYCIYLNYLPTTTKSCKVESYVDDSKLFLTFFLGGLDHAISKTFFVQQNGFVKTIY